MGTSPIQGGQASVVSRVAAQAQAGQALVKPAAARVPPQLAAAYQHRANSLNDFAAAMRATSGPKLASWARQAHHGLSAPGDAVVKALNDGIQSFNKLHAQHQLGLQGSLAATVEQDSRKLENSTKFLKSLNAALESYQAATAGMKGSPAQQWSSAQSLADARRALVQQLSGGSIGLFEGPAAKNLKAAMLQMATFCDTGVAALEGEAKKKIVDQPHVQGLIQGRDLLDGQLQRLFDQQKAQAKANPPASPQAQAKLQASIDILKAERRQISELIGRAIAEGPPVAPPPKTGFFKRLLPSKMRQHFQQNAITRHAAEGQAFKPKAGLEGGQALAAHLKGVFQRAGLSDEAIPSRRAMRNELTAAWAPVVPPKPSAVASASATLKTSASQRPAEVAAPKPVPSAEAAHDARLEADWAALEREAEADVQRFQADRGARGLKGPVSDQEIEAELKHLEQVDQDLLELERQAEKDVQENLQTLMERHETVQQFQQQLADVVKQADQHLQDAERAMKDAGGKLDAALQVQSRLNDQVVTAFSSLAMPMSEEEYEREFAALERELESSQALAGSVSSEIDEFEKAIRLEDAKRQAQLDAELKELIADLSPEEQAAFRQAGRDQGS